MAAEERSALGLGQDLSRYVTIIRTAVVPFAILKLVPVSRIVSFSSHCFCYCSCLPQSLRLACVLGGAESSYLREAGWLAVWQARFVRRGLLLLDLPSFFSLFTLRLSTVGVTLVFSLVACWLG